MNYQCHVKDLSPWWHIQPQSRWALQVSNPEALDHLRDALDEVWKHGVPSSTFRARSFRIVVHVCMHMGTCSSQRWDIVTGFGAWPNVWTSNYGVRCINLFLSLFIYLCFFANYVLLKISLNLSHIFWYHGAAASPWQVIDQEVQRLEAIGSIALGTLKLRIYIYIDRMILSYRCVCYIYLYASIHNYIYIYIDMFLILFVYTVAFK